MGESAELTGPDLAAGAKAELSDGGTLLGHARGEAVLVVRRGAELLAVGATCSHYGGPLAEGLIVGDTVRCPWHHACFDLRSGAASGPAWNAIPCYRVEERGGLIVVGDKLLPGAPATATTPARVVIVGAGPAGAVAAETLRSLGHSGSITLLSAEPTTTIDRPNLSKDYLAGKAPEEWMEVRGRDFYGEKRIDLRLGQSVESLDLKARTATLHGGEQLAWDALVLATGAEPVHLPASVVPDGGERIHYLRTLADSRAIIAAADAAQAKGGGRRAVVIGASFIGLEVAASLRARGLEVTVVAPEERPLERVLGPELSQLIRSVHEANGTHFKLGRTVATVAAGSVTLDDGAVVEADLVVAGVGVRPRIDLAQRAGLDVDRGVLVDAELRAAPGVYAIGDIARFPDRRSGERVRIEHWMVATRHGHAVAHTILGKPAPRFTPFFWSAHHDVTINYVGHAPSFDRIAIDGSLEQRDAAVHYYRGDQLLAVATLGRDRYSLEVAARFEAQ